jgi:nitrate/nitrite transport system substrate-binding protein
MGFGTQGDIITAFLMDLNGNIITVSNDVWAKMKTHIAKDSQGRAVNPIKADALKPLVDEYRETDKTFNMGMFFPVLTHNYEMRYWLAVGGINPIFRTTQT